MRQILNILALLPILASAQVINTTRNQAPPIGKYIAVGTASMTFGQVVGTFATAQSSSYNFAAITAGTGSIAIPSNFQASFDGGTTWTSANQTGISAGLGSILIRPVSSLVAGTYSGDFTFAATGVTPSPTIHVTVTVAAKLLSSSRGALILNGTAGLAGTADSTSVTFANISTSIYAKAPNGSLIVQLSTDGVTWTSSFPMSIATSVGSPFKLYARISSANVAQTVGDTIRIYTGDAGVDTIKLVLSGSISSASTKIERFSFSLTAQVCTNWTNVWGDPSKGGPKTATGALTGWIYTSGDTANYTGNSGAAAFNGNGTQAGTFFSDCAGSASAPMNNGWINGQAFDESKPQGAVSGLDPSKTYNIRFTGSTTGGSQRVTDVHVKGTALSAVKVFTAKNNTANGAEYSNISPSASGVIYIYFNRDTTNIEQGHQDAFTIEENP